MNKYLFQDIVIGNEGLLKGPFGSDLKKSLYVPKGENTYKVYLQENILYETLDAGKHYISKVYFETKMFRYAVKENDFIVTCDGTLGEIYQLKNIKEQGLISSSLLRITLNPSIVDYDYFYYLFKALIKKKLITQANNSVLKHLPGIEMIKKLPIYLPNLDEQKKVGNLLKTIDNKIKNNRKIEKELEFATKTLYDYWFLQFEYPNEDNKPYKSSGGKMVWNDGLKREIPEGWKVKQISEELKIYQPGTIGNDSFVQNGKYKVYGGGGYIGKYNFYNHEKREVIISCRGSCGIVYFTEPYSWITGNAMVFTLKNQEISKEYIYQYFRTFGVEKYLSGSVQKQLTRTNIEKMPIFIPKENVLKKFSSIISNVMELQLKLTNESEELSSIRDFLLPLLMNKQVTLKSEEE